MAGGYGIAADGPLGRMMARIERSERRLSELERPTGTQTAEALAELRAQQSEITAAQAALQDQADLLAQLVTVSSTDGGATQDGAGTTNYTTPPSVTVTIDRPMFVRVDAVMPFEALVGGTGVTVAVYGEWAVGGQPPLIVNEYNKSGSTFEIKRAATNARTYSLAAGTYNITATSTFVSMSAGTAGLDVIVGDSITLTASVLGPA